MRHIRACVLLGTIASVFDSDRSWADAWGPSDAPTIFSPSYQYELSLLPRQGEAATVAWPSTYWPVYHDSINHRWAGPASQSPAEKYQQAFGLSGVEDAVSLHHGIDAYPSQPACTDETDCDANAGQVCAKRRGEAAGFCIPTWWGVTRGWTAAALLHAEPQHAVTHGGVQFEVADIKGLLALVYSNVAATTAGQSCTPPINFDITGRPTVTSDECRDLNAGALHVILGNRTGIEASPFVMDRTFDDEVWNQPVSDYTTAVHTPVSGSQARRRLAAIPRDRRSFEVAAGDLAQLGDLPVVEGESLQIRIAGGGNADLYIRFGAPPTLGDHDCAPLLEDSRESCDLTVPPGESRMFIAIHANTEPTRGRVKIVLSPDAPYAYNPAAVSFARVRTRPVTLNPGLLAADGSSPLTQQKGDLSYILELDAGGNIIGGEWLGASKTNHPDFVWKPTLDPPPAAAGGLITIENVMLLYQMSL